MPNNRRPTPDILGAVLDAPPVTQPRSRRWERQNPVVSYRISRETHDKLKAIVAEMNTQPGFTTTIGQVAGAFLEFGIASWREGTLGVPGKENRRITRGRNGQPPRIEPGSTYAADIAADIAADNV